ncbi:WDR75.2 family protein [Megaselia abdita]
MVCIMSPAKPKHEMKTDDKEIEAIEIDDDSATENTDDDNLKLETLFGGSIIGSKPLFNSKGETVFIIQGNTVVVFSVKTGELINKFEPARDKVIKIEFEIGNKDFLIGCTESGQIVKWKSKKGTIEQKIELKLPKLAKVTAFALVSLDYDDTGLKAIVVYKNPSRVQLLDFFDVKTGTKSKSHFTYDLNMAKVILKVNHELNFFALVQQHTVYVVNVKTWAANRMRNAHMVNVTCLEFHPKEEVIATGDATGKIMLWRNFYDSFPITSLYHWHHTQVNALEFSESGSSLYSSGNESVLVKWGLVRDDKSFLPRLPGNGVQLAICTNNAKLAVSLEDNSILIIGDDQSVETTLQLSSLIPKNKTNLPNFPIGFKLNPRNQSVLYNGRKGQIQFVSTYTKSLLYNTSAIFLKLRSLPLTKSYHREK